MRVFLDMCHPTRRTRRRRKTEDGALVGCSDLPDLVLFGPDMEKKQTSTGTSISLGSQRDNQGLLTTCLAPGVAWPHARAPADQAVGRHDRST